MAVSHIAKAAGALRSVLGLVEQVLGLVEQLVSSAVVGEDALFAVAE